MPTDIRLTYPAPTADGLRARELPFVVGVLADLGSGEGARLAARRFVDIDRPSFDHVLAAVAPRIVLPVEAGRPREVEFRLRAMSDFYACDASEDQAEAAGLTFDDVRQSVKFRRLEATWRGLHYLVSHANDTPAVRIRVLDVTYPMVRRDLERAPKYDQSYLFKFLHDSVYGALDGEPFGLLVYDFSFGHRAAESEPSDASIRVLDQLARISAAIHAPLLAPAHPNLVGAERFDRLGTMSMKEIGRQLDEEAPPEFRAFQASDHAHYACLTLPQVLWREDTRGGHHCWGNAPFVAAARIVESVAQDGFASRITGEHGGLARDLEMTLMPDRSGDLQQVGSTDIAIDDHQELALASRGFACLIRLKNTPGACFWSLPTCHVEQRVAPGAMPRALERRNQLSHVLALSRFAHYLRMLAFSPQLQECTRAEREQLLNAWLRQFVTPSSPAGDDQSRPLLEGRVELEEHALDASSPLRGLTAVAHLRGNASIGADDMTLVPVALGTCGTARVSDMQRAPGPNGLVAWIESPNDIAHLHVARDGHLLLSRSLARSDTLDFGYEGCSVEHLSWCASHIIVVTQERNYRGLACVDPVTGNEELLTFWQEFIIDRDLFVWIDSAPGLLCAAMLPSLEARPPIPHRGALANGGLELRPTRVMSQGGAELTVQVVRSRHEGGGIIDTVVLPTDAQRLAHTPMPELADRIERRLFPSAPVPAHARFVIEAIAHPFMRGNPRKMFRSCWPPEPVWMPVYWHRHLLAHGRQAEAQQLVELLDAIAAPLTDNEPEPGWDPAWTASDGQIELAVRHVRRQSRIVALACRSGMLPAGLWCLLFDPAPGSNVAGSRVDATTYPPALRDMFEQLVVTVPERLPAQR